MTFAYLASFDVSDVRNKLSSISMATSGKTTIVVSLPAISSFVSSGATTTSVYNHWTTGLGAVVDETRDGVSPYVNKYGTSSFAAIMQNAMRTAASSAGWGAQANDIVVSFSTTALQYTFSYSATFTLTFGVQKNRELFGFTGTQSGASSYTSNQTPDFIIVPSLLDISTPGVGDGFNYEPSEIASGSISSSGIQYGISRTTSPLFRDWVQQYEEKAKTMRLSAANTSHPFSHQALRENCRTVHPFIVSGGFGSGLNEAFMLRPDGSSMNREAIQSIAPAYHDRFHIVYKTIVMGTIT